MDGHQQCSLGPSWDAVSVDDRGWKKQAAGAVVVSKKLVQATRVQILCTEIQKRGVILKKSESDQLDSDRNVGLEGNLWNIDDLKVAAGDT